MNHSFKKNIAFTFLTLVGILSLTSCKDSDMEVFVAQDTRNQELIEAIKAIPEPKKEVADKDIEEDKVIIALKQYRLYHSNDTASLAWLQVSLFTWLAIPV